MAEKIKIFTKCSFPEVKVGAGCVNVVQECDARDDDSSNAAG